ncbi:MAG: hypothetical protein IJ661_00215 [Lachnospiraceae bacterium]|nr:hypothetical protein [Lachnospiraceae bacterium]
MAKNLIRMVRMVNQENDHLSISSNDNNITNVPLQPPQNEGVHNKTIYGSLAYNQAIQEINLREYEKMRAFNREMIEKQTSLQFEKEKIKEIEEIKVASKFITVDVYEGVDSCLYVALKNSEDKMITGKKICFAEKIKVTKYKSCYKNYCNYYIIQWGERQKKGVKISSTEFSGELLEKKMKEKNVIFQYPYKYREEIRDSLAQYLIKNAEEIVIPTTYGWNLIDGQWYWAGENSLRMEVLVNEHD